MESEAEGLRRRSSIGGRFRAEIQIDPCVAIPRGPDAGFAAAVREPLVKLQRPKFEFEQWDWDYISWPHDRLDDRKASEEFLHRSALQLNKCERHRLKAPEQQDTELEDQDMFVASLLHVDDEPTGCRSSSEPWRMARQRNAITPHMGAAY
uniref:Uncharacterized protein n=1 Tax=Oryza punctata TaxID=4537 RepID=A0A0E0MB08_ORYPU